MAHTCPACDQLCFCGGDVEDINLGENIHCMHFRQCEQNDYDESDDYTDEDAERELMDDRLSLFQDWSLQ